VKPIYLLSCASTKDITRAMIWQIDANRHLHNYLNTINVKPIYLLSCASTKAVASAIIASVLGVVNWTVPTSTPCDCAVGRSQC
jgi:hypothetical protein